MKLHRTFFSATLLFALAGTALAQTSRSMRVDLKETSLANGLRVITVEDHNAPVIAVAVTYNVGRATSARAAPDLLTSSNT